MWHLGDFFKIPTLTETAKDQMWLRISRYINESGHVAIMANRIPFLRDLEIGIRAAWEPAKAAGEPRSYLLQLALSVSCYLRSYPSFISLLDEIPEFATAFSKLLIGSGEAAKLMPVRRTRRACVACAKEIYLTEPHSGLCRLVYYMSGAVMTMNGDSEMYFCSKACFGKTPFNLWHTGCGICEKERSEGREKVTDQKE